MSEVVEVVVEDPKNLFTSEPSPQNKSCSECQQDARNIFFGMSICQNATFQLGYQNESCSKCHKDVRQSLCHYVNTSVCQYVRMRLFRSGIKMKVVRNVIRMSDRHYVSMSICQ